MLPPAPQLHQAGATLQHPIAGYSLLADVLDRMLHGPEMPPSMGVMRFGAVLRRLVLYAKLQSSVFSVNARTPERDPDVPGVDQADSGRTTPPEPAASDNGPTSAEAAAAESVQAILLRSPHSSPPRGQQASAPSPQNRSEGRGRAYLDGDTSPDASPPGTPGSEGGAGHGGGGETRKRSWGRQSALWQGVDAERLILNTLSVAGDWLLTCDVATRCALRTSCARPAAISPFLCLPQAAPLVEVAAGVAGALCLSRSQRSLYCLQRISAMAHWHQTWHAGTQPS